MIGKWISQRRLLWLGSRLKSNVGLDLKAAKVPNIHEAGAQKLGDIILKTRAVRQR